MTLPTKLSPRSVTIWAPNPLSLSVSKPHAVRRRSNNIYCEHEADILIHFYQNKIRRCLAYVYISEIHDGEVPELLGRSSKQWSSTHSFWERFLRSLHTMRDRNDTKVRYRSAWLHSSICTYQTSQPNDRTELTRSHSKFDLLHRFHPPEDRGLENRKWHKNPVQPRLNHIHFAVSSLIYNRRSHAQVGRMPGPQ